MKSISEWNIIYYKSLESTQDTTAELLNKGLIQHGAVLSTEMQTVGRGRYDRKWWMSYGDIAMTLVLECQQEVMKGNAKGLNSLLQLPYVLSLATLLTIKNLDSQLDLRCKWPNDVLLNGKKLSGIILKNLDGRFILVGVGVNLVKPKKNELIKDNSDLIGSCTNLAEVLQYAKMGNNILERKSNFQNNLLQQIKRLYNHWIAHGFDYIKNLWLENSFALNREVKITTHHKSIKGVFLGILDDGAMILLDQKQKQHKIYMAEVFEL